MRGGCYDRVVTLPDPVLTGATIPRVATTGFIQCRFGPRTGWTPVLRLVTIRSMPGGFHIDKLSDEFGQYTLVLRCSACGHERTAEPHTLGRMCGWDAKLEDVAKRMRCSKCGKKQCTLRAVPPRKPRALTLFTL